MIIDLSGHYQLYKDGANPIQGTLPGSMYLDYMAQGMADPFYGLNETDAHELGHHDYTYERTFWVDASALAKEFIDFVGDGIDTIGTIYINDICVGECANIHRTYRFPVKTVLKEGENTLRIELKDPYRFMEKEAEKYPDFPAKGNPRLLRCIRKTACHFGWDWGPKLCPSGVLRRLFLEAYDARIGEVKILQRHEAGKVTLSVETFLEGTLPEAQLKVLLLHPNSSKEDRRDRPNEASRSDNDSFTQSARFPEANHADFVITDPQLWWPNGHGAQPLYQVRVQLMVEGEVVDEVSKAIGLRTIALDRSKDAEGEQFRFVVNGVPIFAKGADWIPSDQFITRFPAADMEFYIAECQKAHFNMLRVWGGGNYETDTFYDLCDRYGILVWQDFMFACDLYPFDDPDFLANCREEVKDNIRRLRHHASLALWCGNNEVEATTFFIKHPILGVNMDFFHQTLPSWVQEDDEVTPYWPGSPSSGHRHGRVHNFKKGQVSGDSHLWNIWHGMLPIEKFSAFPTRFCSEFGMESMPAYKTVKRFHPGGAPQLFDDVMLLHQKSGGGNAKIFYYLLAKYKYPKNFEDFIYLSQIVQADTVRYATECWKRKMGKQNGALYWQLNDTYPVASWASIDYYKQLKATQYRARHFNKMFMISNDYFKDRFDLYVINEYNRPKAGTLTVELKDFGGALLDSRMIEVTAASVTSQKVLSYAFNATIPKARRKNCFLKATLTEKGEEVDSKTYLLVPDKDASLPKDPIDVAVREDGGEAVITLCCPSFKRYVYVDCEALWSPFSDNFFDLEPGVSKEIRIPLEGTPIDQVQKNLVVKDLSSIEVEESPLKNRWLRTKMFFKDKNWLTYVVYKLLLS